jgi:transposase InsO family protein
MSKARLIITAVVVEGRSQHEVARAYGISQSWVSRLVARYHAQGEAAFQPRSRRPKTSPTAIPPATVTLITQLRDKLTSAVRDAGPDTIARHLAHHHGTRVSVATISRYLTRLGLVTLQPAKRPRASYQRFQAALPNQCWQADFTHYPLAGSGDVPAGDAEILTWLDDHSRYALDVTAHQPVTGPIVGDRFLAAVARFGTPASTLTDNGMVFTTRFAGGRDGRNALEAELRRCHVEQKNSRPNKPTTCGKVERFQQTLKKWLAAQPTSPPTWSSSSSCWTSSWPSTTSSAPTGPCPAGPPRPWPTRPAPKPPPLPTATTTPTTASGTTASTPTAKSPCGSTAASTTLVSAEPTPEPLSCCSSKTSTSASSTRPPASYCAS